MLEGEGEGENTYKSDTKECGGNREITGEREEEMMK